MAYCWIVWGVDSKWVGRLNMYGIAAAVKGALSQVISLSSNSQNILFVSQETYKLNGLFLLTIAILVH